MSAPISIVREVLAGSHRSANGFFDDSGVLAIVGLVPPATDELEAMVVEIEPFLCGAEPPEYRVVKGPVKWPRESDIFAAYLVLTADSPKRAVDFFRSRGSLVRANALLAGSRVYGPWPLHRPNYGLPLGPEFASFARECAQSSDPEESFRAHQFLSGLNL